MVDGDGNDHHFEISRSQSPSINSQSYAIPLTDEIIDQLSECSSVEGSDDLEEYEGENADEFLDTAVPETSNAFFLDTQDSGPIFDVSKYIFESLEQAINIADFSEAISLQTKTSAVINSKSMELKQLVQSTKVRLAEFKERFEKGAQVSKMIRHNLQESKERIDRINSVVATDFPIEFNQAKEKIVERHLDDASI